MKSIEIMHKFFGSGHPSDKCGDCKNLIKDGNYYKCRIYGNTSSEASDWRKKWNACAMFNVPYNGMPIIEVKKHMSKILAETQIEGQMSIEDYLEGGM